MRTAWRHGCPALCLASGPPKSTLPGPHPTNRPVPVTRLAACCSSSLKIASATYRSGRLQGTVRACTTSTVSAVHCACQHHTAPRHPESFIDAALACCILRVQCCLHTTCTGFGHRPPAMVRYLDHAQECNARARRRIVLYTPRVPQLAHRPPLNGNTWHHQQDGMVYSTRATSCHVTLRKSVATRHRAVLGTSVEHRARP